MIIILSLCVVACIGQPVNKINPDMTMLKKELTYVAPVQKRDITMVGFAPKKHGWDRVKITLKVGINTSELNDLIDQYEETNDISDVFDSIDLMSLIKESYRIKIRMTKTFKVIINAQILGFNKFTDKSSVYSMGIIKKF